MCMILIHVFDSCHCIECWNNLEHVEWRRELTLEIKRLGREMMNDRTKIYSLVKRLKIHNYDENNNANEEMFMSKYTYWVTLLSN